MRTLVVLILCISSLSAVAQKDLLQSGPMLGYSEMREVMLWVQTTEPATVQFAYWPEGEKTKVQLTDPYQTSKAEVFTAKVVADAVEPGTTYKYELRINDKAVKLGYPTVFQTQELWQWRTDPPTFTMALGSCSYVNEPVYDRPGNSYGGDYQIFDAIHERRPDAMLWLGDNIYLREVDWFSRTGIMKRYTHTRSLAEMQPLLASTHHYAIWDDHDYGPNDSDRSYIHKHTTLEAFRRFWGNPTYGLNGDASGITTAFTWADMDFFLLDNRFFRKPNRRSSGESVYFGEDQLEWLIDALANSRAPFKFVATGGQILNTEAVYENYINLAPEERAYLLGRIAEEDIKGVIFLTGDRHHTELSSYVNSRGNVVYDLTVSPLTSGSGSNRDGENNEARKEGTLVVQRNFGLLTVSGAFRERELLIQIFDTAGEELWQETIPQPEY
ncbi:MAG: alkaline phosphatase D family protein [Bacteroidota bacterium]